MPTLSSSLGARGALVPVEISLSAPDIQALRAACRPIPQPIDVHGLVDTGADMTSVGLLRRLAPLTGGITLANLPAHGGLTPAFHYDVNLAILHPAGNHLLLPDWRVLELSTSALGIEAIIGRDILALCDFLYQGRQARFELTY